MDREAWRAVIHGVAKSRTRLSDWIELNNAGDQGSIPGLGRSPGEGNGTPLQYSCLENPMDRGAWWSTVHRVTKSRTWLSMCVEGRISQFQHSWQCNWLSSDDDVDTSSPGGWSVNYRMFGRIPGLYPLDASSTSHTPRRDCNNQGCLHMFTGEQIHPWLGTILLLLSHFSHVRLCATP